jgi:hypothetical protein
MQDQINNKEWSKNKSIGGLINTHGLENDRGGLINLPTYHLVDINQVTLITSNYWITSVLYGLGIASLYELLKKIYTLLTDDQYAINIICLPLIFSIIFFILALLVNKIFILNKFKKLREEAVQIPLGEIENFIKPFCHTGDMGGYRNSVST